MALRWMEGFETFIEANIGSDLFYKYPQLNYSSDSYLNANSSVTSSRYGGNCLETDNNIARYIHTPLFPAHKTIITGFAFQVSNGFEDSSPETQNIMSIGYDTGGAPISHLRMFLSSTTTFSAAKFDIRRGDGTLLATTTTTFVPNTWYYVELKVVIDDTVGQIVLRVNEEVDVDLSGIDTADSSPADDSANYVLLYTGWSDPGDNLYLDDWYVCDGSGTINNDFLGDCHIEAVFPAGAGDSTQWTPSTGNNWECVDDGGSNQDFDYIESDTPGNKDLYTVTSLTSITDNIAGLQLNAEGWEAGATARTTKMILKVGSTEYDGSARAFPGGNDYSQIHEIYEMNPDTGASWTATEINSLQIGLELVS